MSSQPPDSGTAEQTGSSLPGGGIPELNDPGGSHSGSGQTRSHHADLMGGDSRVVVVRGQGAGISPADVMPDEKTVISAAKALAAPPELAPISGAKNAAQHLGLTLIGRRLEHYQLEEFVGGGGMGAVFRATDTRLGRTVAVKVLSRDQSSEENVRRFRNEAQSAARLDHRNLARVHYVGEDAGLNFIVFEFIEGINLREVVQQQGPLPLDEALRYTVQVAEALAHASQRDVVHRDIKPSNVLVTPSGQIKVVDMGLARLHQVDSSFDDLTASGVTLGTFDYISPEQARDPRAADVRSDIYSLGCTLYFMLTGKPPFPDGSALQKLLRHNGVDPPDVRLFRPELPPAIGSLLGKMLAKRPVQRQQSADELIVEIERIARDAGLDIGKTSADIALAAGQGTSAWLNWAMTILAPVAVLVVSLVGLEYATRPPVSDARVQLRPTAAIPSEVEPNPPETAVTPDSPATEPPPVTKNGEGTKPEINGSTAPGTKGPKTTDEPSPSTLIDDSPRVSPPQVGPPPDLIASRDPPVTTTTPLPDVTPPPKPPAPKVVVRRGQTSPDPTSETAVFGSLSQAVRWAAEKGIAEIELDYNGESVEHPFEVPGVRMVVRPAPGRKPVIVFRPELSTVSDQRQMIHLLGSTSRLALVDLDIRLELPTDASYDWSLVTIHQGQTLDLANCVLTVVDQGLNGVPVHEQVSFVQLQTRRLAEMMKMDDEMAMTKEAAINLSNCFARGEATFLYMPEEIPVSLDWNQGLFVSSKRFVETGGATTTPRLTFRIELSLSRVTIAAQQGLFQMLRKKDALHHLELDVHSDLSIFSVGGEAPLFEFAGMPTIDDINFNLRGTDNCYPREDMIFLRARPAGTGEGTIDYKLANRSRWTVNERSPDLGVIWQSAPAAGLATHLQLPENYKLAETSPHVAGFRPDDLPRPTEPASKALKPMPEVAPEAAPQVTPAKPANPAATSAPAPEPAPAPATDAEPPGE